MRGLKVVLAIFFILSAATSFAEPGGELVLIKTPQTFAAGRGCYGMFHVTHEQDVPDMRDFRYFSCEGPYNLTLSGPAGKVVTVFGTFDFKKEYGFLIIKKMDDRLIWIVDLEGFPNRKWRTVEAKGEYGGYEAFYYRTASGFENNISSVKWGEWWKPDDLKSPDH